MNFVEQTGRFNTKVKINDKCKINTNTRCSHERRFRRAGCGTGGLIWLNVSAVTHN